MELEDIEDRFDTRSAKVLLQALSDGLFLVRDVTPQSDEVVVDGDKEGAMCSAFFTSKAGATGILNIMWRDVCGLAPFSVFAYSGQKVKLKEGVSYDEICARCFQVNQETPLSNVSFRIDEPELFQKKGEGYIVCISGLPLLPFETELNYRDGGVTLESLLVGAMESAFAGEQMIPAFFDDCIE